MASITRSNRFVGEAGRFVKTVQLPESTDGRHRMLYVLLETARYSRTAGPVPAWGIAGEAGALGWYRARSVRCGVQGVTGFDFVRCGRGSEPRKPTLSR